ncbi:hypothetical protein ACWC10_02945 [Streptomyces sp. NPDC001595]|uniref:hypothetical protein n=1 Tax=Streptomyces sp. NPDC001532 TaxID=3154520 RepID=UPI00332A8A32
MAPRPGPPSYDPGTEARTHHPCAPGTEARTHRPLHSRHRGLNHRPHDPGADITTGLYDPGTAFPATVPTTPAPT